MEREKADSEIEGDSGNARYRAPALEKGLDILELLSTEREPMTTARICRRLERSQGEMFRMVQVLEARGFIEQDPETDGYFLTDRLFLMAMRQPSTHGLVELALPVMRALAAEVGQSCHLALFARGDIVVVARMESDEQLGFTVRVGYRRPITKTVPGLTLFAFQPGDVRQRWLGMIDPRPTAEELADFIARADGARSDGIGTAPNSYVDGITDISAPIMRGDRAAAALTIPYIKTASSRGTIAEVSQKLLSAATTIAEQLTEGDSRA